MADLVITQIISDTQSVLVGWLQQIVDDVGAISRRAVGAISRNL